MKFELFETGGTGLGIFLGLLLLWLPGASHGQELKFSGEIEAGFGSVRLDEAATRSVEGIGEATLNVSTRRGAVSAQVEITVAESQEQLDGAEHEIVWRPVEGFAITISGASLEMEATEGNISVVNAPEGPVGDEEANLDFSGTGLIDFRFVGESFSLGIAILDTCVPECGYAIEVLNEEEEAFHPALERMTALLHLMGEIGALMYKAYLAGSSGSFASPNRKGVGLGSGIGVVYEGDALSAGLDYSLAKVECVGSEFSCTDDNEVAQFGFSLNVAGLGLHYYFGEDKTGADSEETTNVDVVYLFEAGDLMVGPEYRITKTEATGETATTDTFLLLGASLEF